jgi:hypothetical protein
MAKERALYAICEVAVGVGLGVIKAIMEEAGGLLFVAGGGLAAGLVSGRTGGCGFATLGFTGGFLVTLGVRGHLNILPFAIVGSLPEVVTFAVCVWIGAALRMQLRSGSDRDSEG